MKIHFNTEPMQLERNLKNNHACQALNIVRRADKRPHTPRPDFIGVPLFLEGNNYREVLCFTEYQMIPTFQGSSRLRITIAGLIATYRNMKIFGVRIMLYI